MNASLFKKCSNAPSYHGAELNVAEDILRERASLEGDNYIIAAPAEISSFGMRTSFGTVEISIPKQFLDDHESFLDFRMFGNWFTERIARNIFGLKQVQNGYDESEDKLKKHSFSLVPGEFKFEGPKLKFIGQDPRVEKPTSILFYIDVPMRGYAGKNELTTFNIGRSGLYAIILSLDYLAKNVFVGYNVSDLRDAMEYGLKMFFGE